VEAQISFGEMRAWIIYGSCNTREIERKRDSIKDISAESGMQKSMVKEAVGLE